MPESTHTKSRWEEANVAMNRTVESKNKALVLEAFDTLFNKRDYAAAEKFWSPHYIQHSAHIAPGREGLFDLIKSLPPGLKYEPGTIVAEGNVVIVHGRFSNFVAYLQTELIVNYFKVVIVAVDNPPVSKEVRDGIGATFAFLCDADRKIIRELDIVDATDPVHGPVAIPYTFLLDGDLSIYKIYNGWWYVGRPTVEEIRTDFRALLSRRADWWYGKSPAPYAARESHT